MATRCAVAALILLAALCAGAAPAAEPGRAPRRPQLPPALADKLPGAGTLPGAGVIPGGNPIDRLLQPYFDTNKIAPPSPVDDRVFARRVYLDLVGLLPAPQQVEAFVNDDRPDKRDQLVRRLLDDRKAYTEHWLTFWNDMLRNAYRGTGYIDGGRKQITTWLYTSLYENKPYDKFVHELISPPAGSEAGGFINGIIWRGVVNASQTRQMQAAQNIGQVFMGTNLKCASCHDSFVNDWKLTDSYGLAAVFSDQPLEIHRCNKATGKIAQVGFIYPQLGQVDAKAPRATRMAQLADIITNRQNGRLSRTMVNRLWAVLMGRGIVEPVDDMDQKPWHRDLLDWLASDLSDQGYDLKRTMALICTSRAYQAPTVGAPPPDQAAFTFHGPIVKRMTAEQFVDAVAVLTGASAGNAAVKLPAVGAGDKAGGAAASASAPGVRAALMNDDVLTRALGRPNREQVVTRRDSVATTLQALEMTNGDTLDNMLKKGAAHWLQGPDKAPKALIQNIYRAALARAPSADELAAARGLVGSPPTEQGVQDLLWVIVMLPEFQLVY